MSDLDEIQEAIEKLSEDQRRWLDTLQDEGVEESDELMAATDEGIRSLEVQGGIPVEQARERLLNRWRTR